MSGEAAWSPDGTYFAAQSIRSSVGRHVSAIVLHNTMSNERREFVPRLGWALQHLHWSPDNRWLVVESGDGEGRQGLYRIDVGTKSTVDGSKIYFRRDATTENQGVLVEHDLQSGAERVLFDEWARDLYLSADGRSLTFVRLLPEGKRPPETYVVAVRDLATGADREVVRRARLRPAGLSSDGRFAGVTTSEEGASAKYDTVLFIPTSGDEAREVFRAPKGQSASVLAAIPNGEALLVRTSAGTPTVPGELWWFLWPPASLNASLRKPVRTLPQRGSVPTDAAWPMR